jgi:hypothetical protein
MEFLQAAGNTCPAQKVVQRKKSIRAVSGERTGHEGEDDEG